MIQFDETYRFENDLGKFEVNFKTAEHPSGYGNGMLLCTAPVEHPKGVCAYDLCRSYDIRYEPVGSTGDLRELAMAVLERDYGVDDAEVA